MKARTIGYMIRLLSLVLLLLQFIKPIPDLCVCTPRFWIISPQGEDFCYLRKHSSRCGHLQPAVKHALMSQGR